MSTAWIAAFVLLAILNIALATVLVAVMRQIGVLHQRVKPTGPGSHEGPQPGYELPLVALRPVGSEPPPERQPFGVPVTVLAYVSPGCSLCEELPGAVRSLLRHADHDDLLVAFATDTPLESARHYAAEMALPAPLFHGDGLGRSWGLPGSPYVIAVSVASSSSVRVLACGVVNTLEQLEDLVGDALDQTALLQAPEDQMLAGDGDGWSQGRLTVVHSAAAGVGSAEEGSGER